MTLISARVRVDWPSGVISAVSSLVVDIDSEMTCCIRGVSSSSRTAFCTSVLAPEELPPEDDPPDEEPPDDDPPEDDPPICEPEDPPPE